MFVFQREKKKFTRIMDRTHLKAGTKNTICTKLNTVYMTRTRHLYSVKFGWAFQNEVIVCMSIIAIHTYDASKRQN